MIGREMMHVREAGTYISSQSHQEEGNL